MVSIRFVGLGREMVAARGRSWNRHGDIEGESRRNRQKGGA